MADQAVVYVKNLCTGDINVIPSVSGEPETITNGDKHQFYLAGTDELLINAPAGVDIKECYIKVRSDIDLAVPCFRTDSNWKIKIEPNTSPPEAPTTVNIDIGEDE